MNVREAQREARGLVANIRGLASLFLPLLQDVLGYRNGVRMSSLRRGPTKSAKIALEPSAAITPKLGGWLSGVLLPSPHIIRTMDPPWGF